jgi:uncharacterized glyoxalase superfamily metalloenzyme YdcJ
MKKSVLIPWEKYEKLMKPECEEEQQQQHQSYNQDKIISTVPQKMRSRAQALLELLPQTDISWNQRGELVVNGDHIEGSNICDLVKCALLNYKNFQPKGYQAFIQTLAANNIPETLIQNTKCRRNVQNVKSNSKEPKPWLTL